MTQHRWKTPLLAAGLLVATGLVAFGGLGYLGGDGYREIPATIPASGVQQRPVALLFSSDTGSRIGMGPALARRLAKDGIPVVTVNSLTLFRHRQSPGAVRKLVVAAIKRAQRFGKTRDVILIGHSFGADMLQVGLEGLPLALRQDIRLIVLIVPGTTVQFRASPAEIFSRGEPAYPALSTARQLDWAPLLCIYGEEEKDSLCPLIKMRNAHVVALPGGHLLRRDAGRVYATLAPAIAREAIAREEGARAVGG